MIQIKINGQLIQVEQSNLKQFLNHRQKDGASYAVAVNEYFIPKANYAETQLKQGDQIELVMPMQGG